MARIFLRQQVQLWNIYLKLKKNLLKTFKAIKLYSTYKLLQSTLILIIELARGSQGGQAPTNFQHIMSFCALKGGIPKKYYCSLRVKRLPSKQFWAGCGTHSFACPLFLGEGCGCSSSRNRNGPLSTSGPLRLRSPTSFGTNPIVTNTLYFQ